MFSASRVLAGAGFALALLAGAPLQAQAQAQAGMHAKAPGAMTEKVSVTGAVEQPLVLGVADLRALPAVEVAVTRQGAGVGDKPALLKGALLRDVLAKAVVLSHEHNDVKKIAVIAAASDGYKVVFSWSEIFNSPAGDSILVYYEKDGQPLGENEGRIALIAAKDLRTGPRHVKWLQALEVKKIAE